MEFSAHTQPDAPLSLISPPADLPLLASTTFCMDLLLQSTVLDLKSLEEILTFDPCALLRIFRQIATLIPDPDERPRQLGECIVALGSSGLRRALVPSPSTWQQQAQLQTFAEHSTAIARAAQLLAGTVALFEETAFLVGALHALGTLPGLLRPELQPLDAPSTLQELNRLCTSHSLPEPLHAAILAVHQPEQVSAWSMLIDAAHEMTETNVPSASMSFP